MSSTSERYHPLSIALHWLMAFLLIGLCVMGWMLADLPFSPRKLQWYSWHKWAGVTAFLLVIVRLLWRWQHTPPPLDAHMDPLTMRLAHWGHAGLYVLMIVIPLSGWLMSSAKGFQTVWFGVLPLPDVIAPNEIYATVLTQLHVTFTTLLALLVAAHVAAALKHHWLDRDQTLRRMRPW